MRCSCLEPMRMMGHEWWSFLRRLDLGGGGTSLRPAWVDTVYYRLPPGHLNKAVSGTSENMLASWTGQ